MRLIAAVSAVLFSAPAGADHDPGHALFQAQARITEMACEAEGSLGRAIMGLRQAGGSLESALGDMKNERHREMVRAAYAQPRHRSADARQWAVREFGDQAEVECYRRHVNQ